MTVEWGTVREWVHLATMFITANEPVQGFVCCKSGKASPPIFRTQLIIDCLLSASCSVPCTLRPALACCPTFTPSAPCLLSLPPCSSWFDPLRPVLRWLSPRLFPFSQEQLAALRVHAPEPAQHPAQRGQRQRTAGVSCHHCGECRWQGKCSCKVFLWTTASYSIVFWPSSDGTVGHSS